MFIHFCGELGFVTWLSKAAIFTFALKAISFTTISNVKRTVKMMFRVSDSFVTWSDWLQC